MPEPFPSLESLRAAHAELMRRWRDTDRRAALLDEVEAFVRKGCSTGALLSEEDDRWAAQSILDYWTTALFREHRDAGDVLLAEFDPSFAPELDDAQCPYVGLASFQEGKATVFFGRERLSNDVLECLQTTRLLFVLGASGSGKSSLVRAGVVPKLRAGKEIWNVLPPVVPGSQPLQNLCHALRPADAPPGWTVATAAKLERDPSSVDELLPSRQTLVCVDQFEEAFTLTPEGPARQAFFECLRRIASGGGVRHTVIITMRSDFEGQLLRIPSLSPYFEDAIRVPPLNAAELREAIEKPAALIGLKFEDGLVDELLSQILGEPAGLPLLQFTLLELWERRDRNRITWANYRGLGGARNALGVCADRFYSELLPEDQQTVKRILLRLVRPGPGYEITSGRITRDRLGEIEASDRVKRVLDRLVEARLLKVSPGETPADDQVEVAHEALVRNWPRLVNWLEDERRKIERQRWLTERAARWEQLGEEDEALLRGRDLTEAQQLDSQDLTALEQRYVQLSVEAAQEAERARDQAAARLTRKNRLLRTLAAGLAISLFAAIYFSVQSRHSQRVAEVRLLTSVSERLRGLNNYEMSALLARQAYFKDNQSGSTAIHEVDAALRSVLTLPYFGRVLHEHSRAEVLAYCPGQRLLAEASGGRVEVLAFEERKGQDLMRSSELGSIRSLAFDSSCAWLGAGTDRGEVFLWNTNAPDQRPRRVSGLPDAVTCLAVSPNGFAACQEDTKVRYWNTAQPSSAPILLPTIESAAAKVTALAFDPAGDMLAAGLSEGTLAVWTNPGGALTPARTQLTGLIASLLFSGNSELVAIAGRTVSALSYVGPPAVFRGDPRPLARLSGLATSLSVSRDGKQVVVGDVDGTVLVWSGQEPGAAPVVLRGADEPVLFTAFDKDNRLYSGSSSFSLREWLPRSEPSQLSAAGSDYAASFNPGGEWLALVEANTVSLYQTNPWKRVWLTAAHPQPIYSVAVCDRQERLATTSLDARVRVWNSADPLQPAFEKETSMQPSQVALDSAGRLVAFVGRGGDIEIWDTVNNKRQRSIRTTGVATLALRPDGRAVAWSGEDGKVQVLENGAERVPWTFEGPVKALAYSGDGSLLAAATERRVSVVTSKGEPRDMPGLEPNQRIQGVALSAAGDQIAVAVEDTMLLWNARKPAQLPIVLRGHGSYIRAMAFRRHTAGGKGLLLSAGNERTLLWSSTEALAALVCEKTRGRPLSKLEWERWVGAGVTHEKGCPE